MSKINTEESPYELSLNVSATGNAAARLSVYNGVSVVAELPHIFWTNKGHSN